ncbi:ABC-type glycerol-3-phosphate transport system substrate-binding protein [Kineothrix alysoides]|uniref:ABC-type glycerol-3-phosphate transport system substrate-binding protein n=1 Tax=Kineothrix alysoides TaxID=1469948 RepID=A0A4R1QNC4_9FIRM|nr:ABC transporter substrate-binding protein [Kineothrix alysoides]TCL54473.1 ABC-type glycerol-3-phosphate transport system substrate-binding protein [Kineothrix alysoides]
MKREFFRKRLISLFLTGAMILSTAGCGAKDMTMGSSNGDAEQAAQIEDSVSATGEGSKGMGRYVENVTDLSEYCYRPDGIAKLSDGKLIIADYYMGQIKSEDNGITWNPEETDWFTALQAKDAYIMDIAIGADGTTGVIYDASSSSGEETDLEEALTKANAVETDGGEAGKEADVGETGSEVSGEGEDNGEASDELFQLHPVCMIVKPDGTRIEAQFSLTEDEKYPYGIWIADSGRIFVTTLGEIIYEVNEDGSSEKFLTVEERPEMIQLQGDLMIIDGYAYANGILIYDMAKEEYVEDEVLNDFVLENYTQRERYGFGTYDLYFFTGEDGVLYMAGKKGLHRHVIGGSAIEQVIDGNLSSFSNPADGLIGMVALENNEFLTLFSGGKLVHYVYNADIPSTPSEKLKVYSLKENDTMSQAISIYQTENPDVFVDYEIGMGDDNSVMRDDALKKLNTQIMAGEGPDLLVLDNMPLDSYIEKGMLLDLSTCLSGLTGDAELFSNITDAFKKNGGIYTIPCEVQLPLVLGKEKYVSGMKNMKGIADAMEALREDNQEGGLLDIYSERGIIRLLAMISSPAWKTKNGGIDETAVSEFLTEVKRVYDAQMEGASEKDIDRYNSVNDYYMTEYATTREEWDYFGAMDEMGYIGGMTNMVLGTLSDPYSYATLNSVQRVKGFEDNVLLPVSGQSTNVFIPKTLIGISAVSANTEMAQELLKVLLGKENQVSLFNGLAVNKAAFEESFVPKEENMGEDGLYGSIGMSDGDGMMVSLDVYWVDEGQLQKLRDWMAKADTPYVKDTVLEDSVCEEGINYMQGGKSLEESVSAIVEKVAIYMAE